MKRLALICGFLSLLLLVVPEESSSVIIRGPVASINTRSFRHQGTLYIPVASLVRAFGLVLKESGGPIFVFESPQCRLALAVGSREARINGETVRMIGPADMVDGKLSVPIYLAIQTMKERFPTRIEPVEPPPPSPKEAVRIVLDPGHGGADTGAVGSGGLEEKEVALEIAGKVKVILEGKGYEALMTRTGDGFVSLKKRARLANRNEADLLDDSYREKMAGAIGEGIADYVETGLPRKVAGL